MIEMKLVRTKFFTRWNCTVCGGHTEKDAILCEGESDSMFVRACTECLKSPESVDEKLERQAIELEDFARSLREIKGKLILPSYEQWASATEAANDEFQAAHGMPREFPF